MYSANWVFDIKIANLLNSERDADYVDYKSLLSLQSFPLRKNKMSVLRFSNEFSCTETLILYLSAHFKLATSIHNRLSEMSADK